MRPGGARRRARRPLAVVALLVVLLAGCALEGSRSREVGADGLRPVRVGYLHTPAVDTHLWLGITRGHFARHGLRIEPIPFETGIAESQALTGGSIDVAIMGAVIANFPAQGQGKVFLLNNVERDTAQLWVAPDSGIRTPADLAGRQVATTEGTTAHIFLRDSLAAHGTSLDRTRVVNSAMPAATNAFITGAVPAVALWAPFDLQVQRLAPGARKIDSAGSYFPDTAIAGGWVANNQVYAEDPELLRSLTAAWLDINEALLTDTEASLRAAHAEGYSGDLSFEEFRYIFTLEEVYSNEEWARLYADGQVARWMGGLTRAFVELGGLPRYADPASYLDTQMFQDVLAGRR